MKLYHTTSQVAADKIAVRDFEDATGSYGFTTFEGEPVVLTGVWFADRPLGVSEGAKDDPFLDAPVFVIELDEEAVLEYEIIDSSPTYREWCIPALLANSSPRRVIYLPSDDELENVDLDHWWEGL